MESTPRESTRLDSLRLSPPFTLVHQAANFKILLNRIKRKVSYGRRFETINQSRREIPVHLYTCVFTFVPFRSLVRRLTTEETKKEEGEIDASKAEWRVGMRRVRVGEKKGKSATTMDGENVIPISVASYR